MQLEIIIVSGVSHKEKDKYHMMSFICGAQNIAQKSLSTKQKQTYQKREQTCGGQRMRGGRRKEQEFRISRYKLLYIERINNKVVLYSTGNYIQYLVDKLYSVTVINKKRILKRTPICV